MILAGSDGDIASAAVNGALVERNATPALATATGLRVPPMRKHLPNAEGQAFTVELAPLYAAEQTAAAEAGDEAEE